VRGSMRLLAITASAALALTTLAVMPLATAAATALPLYHVDAIVPGGVATAINEQGDFVGWQVVNGSPRAFAHRGGQLTLLPTSSDRPLSVARDVNDAGVVVGYAYKTPIDEPGNAVRWTPGTTGWAVRDLGFLPGDLVSEAKGINELGLIVGRSNPRSFLQEHGFVFSPGAGMTAITAASDKFVPEDVNELGVVVGTGYSTAQRVDTISGATKDLGTLAPYGYSHAYAINDVGQISGALTSSSGQSQVLARYSDTTGWQVLGGIGVASGSNYVTNIGWGINNAGTVVGVGWPRTGTLPSQRAVIFLDSHGSLLYVDDLLEAGSDWSVYQAYDINDLGQIAGYARNRLTGATAAVRLTPVGTLGIPAAPTGLTAAPHAAVLSQDQNRIDLRWVDNTTFETAYELQRRQIDAAGAPITTFTQIASLSPGAIAYTDTALALAARYEYRVRAMGLAGASAFSNRAIATAPASTPESTAPVVSIISPAAGSTVGGRVSVKIRASDNVGVVRVELLVDTELVGTCNLGTAQTYTCTWATRQWSNGGWTLYARAWDKAGNLGVHAITVVVKNSRKH
jgi:uncharacterized membrane protein